MQIYIKWPLSDMVQLPQ